MPLWRLRIAHCASQSSLSSTTSKRFWLVQPHTAVRHAATLANCASSTSPTALPPSFNSFTGAAPPLGKNTIDRPAASSLAQGGLVSSPSSHSSQLQQHSFQPFCCRGSHPGGRIMLKKKLALTLFESSHAAVQATAARPSRDYANSSCATALLPKVEQHSTA